MHQSVDGAPSKISSTVESSSQCMQLCQITVRFFSNLFKVKTPEDLQFRQEDMKSNDLLKFFINEIESLDNTKEILIQSYQVQFEKQLFLECLQQYLEKKKTFIQPLGLNIARLSTQKSSLEKMICRCADSGAIPPLLQWLDLCFSVQEPCAISQAIERFLEDTAGSSTAVDWAGLNTIFGNFSVFLHKANSLVSHKIEIKERGASILRSQRRSAEVVFRLSQMPPVETESAASILTVESEA